MAVRTRLAIKRWSLRLGLRDTSVPQPRRGPMHIPPWEGENAFPEVTLDGYSDASMHSRRRCRQTPLESNFRSGGAACQGSARSETFLGLVSVLFRQLYYMLP